MNNNNYNTLNRISYSKLSLLDRSPYLFYKKYILEEEIDKDTIFTNIGSATDCMLTQPDKFYDLFHISTSIKPTGQLENFVTKLIDLKKDTIDAFNEAYEYTKHINGGKLRDNIEKFIERFHKEAINYFEDHINSENKIILTFDEFTKVQETVNNLKTNIFTSRYLSDTLHNNIERYYQHENEFILKNICYIVKIDCIIIDHNNKTIQPIDIKTTFESPYNFSKSIIKYRYDLQAVIYDYYINEIFVITYNLKDYQILPFKFIVINADSPQNPLIWNMSFIDHFIAKIGKSGNQAIKGLWNLIDDLNWHINNNKWDYKRELYESNGVINTKLYE